MADYNDLLDTIIASIRYAFSNMGSLLIGGVVLTLSLLFIGLPFFLGYITRCIREIIRGNGVLPEWDSIPEIFIDGMKMTVVFAIYALISLILAVIATIPTALLAYFNIRYLVYIGMAVLGLSLIIIISVIGLVFFTSWVIYANTRSIRAALSPGNIEHLVLINPRGYLVTVLSSSVVAVLGWVPMALVFTIPWMIFTICVAITFTYSKYYQDTMKMNEAATGQGIRSAAQGTQ